MHPSQANQHTSGNSYTRAGGAMQSVAGAKSNNGVMTSAMIAQGIIDAQSQMCWILIKTILHGIKAPFECMMRREIGENYYTAITSMMTYLTYWFYYIYYDDHSDPLTAKLACYCAIFFAVIFFTRKCDLKIRIFARDRRGDYWYSRAVGHSLSIFNPLIHYQYKNRFQGDFARMYGEPFLMIILSFLTFMIFEPLGIMVSVATVATILFEMMNWSEHRKMILDEKDKRLEAEVRRQNEKGTEAPGIKGYCGAVISGFQTTLQWQT